ncbi:hypothetical protein CDIK_1760 [Cucumispora dikerogammari]|nr:hypothetical protein CDIK_1760 [Cucumispora dikerogammari]
MINVKNKIDLLKIIDSTSKIIDFFQNHGVLKTNFNCQKCRKNMKRYTIRNKEESIMMCTSRICEKKQQSIRKNSVFFKIKAPLSKILLIIYECSQFTSLKNIKKECGVGMKLINTIIDIFKHQFKKMKKTKIGGPNEVIKVDETALSTTKYNTIREEDLNKSDVIRVYVGERKTCSTNFHVEEHRK